MGLGMKLAQALTHQGVIPVKFASPKMISTIKNCFANSSYASLG